MPTIIDQRIASKLHIRQIEAIARCEGIGDAVDKLIDSAIAELLKRAGDHTIPAWNRLHAATNDVRQILPKLIELFGVKMELLARWSYAATASVLAESVPRRWWESLLTSRRVGEAVGHAGPLEISTTLDQLDLLNASAAEWQGIVKSVIIPPPTPEKVSRIIHKNDPKTGLDWEDRLRGLSKKIESAEAVASQLVVGYAAGETVDQLSKRLEPHVQGIKSSARRIARTEGLRVAETAQQETFAECEDIMSGQQITAVLDENTRPEHATRNGTIYYYKPTLSQKSIQEMPQLPDAPNCRCWSAPVLKTPRDLEKMPELARELSTAGSGNVPDVSSYDQWWKGADIGRQKMVVGAKRHSAVSQRLAGIRQPEWSDFVDSSGRLLTAEELSSETSDAFSARSERVRQAIGQRNREIRQVSRTGFLTPTRSPTVIKGHTFSGRVDPTSEVSILGEEIRQAISKGVNTEKERLAIGSRLREAVETKKLQEMQSAYERMVDEYQSLKKSGVIDPRAAEAISLAKQAVGEERQRRFLEVMSAVRDMGTQEHQLAKKGSDPSAVQAVHNAQRFFPKDWNDKFRKGGEIKITNTDRGFYNHASAQLALSHGIEGHRSTAVHEMAHRAECLIPGLVQAEKKLYDTRTKGDKLKKISFLKKEYTKRDEWLGDSENGYGEYMGKSYGGEAFEIMSMGMEGLSYSAFTIHKDQETYNFLLGALATL